MCLSLFLHSYSSFCISGSSLLYESLNWETHILGGDRQHLLKSLLIRSHGSHMLEETQCTTSTLCLALDSPCFMDRHLGDVMKHGDSFYLMSLTSDRTPSRLFLTPSSFPFSAVHGDLWRRGPDPISPLCSAGPAFLKLSAPAETSGATSL